MGGGRAEQESPPPASRLAAEGSRPGLVTTNGSNNSRRVRALLTEAVWKSPTSSSAKNSSSHCWLSTPLSARVSVCVMWTLQYGFPNLPQSTQQTWPAAERQQCPLGGSPGRRPCPAVTLWVNPDTPFGVGRWGGDECFDWRHCGDGPESTNRIRRDLGVKFTTLNLKRASE